MPQFRQRYTPLSVRLLAASAIAALSATPLVAQLGPSPGLNSRIIIHSEWLQANAMPLDRDALPSLAIMGSYRRPSWSVDAGWLRVARDLSSVHGGAVMIGRPVTVGPLLFIPAIGGFGGRAQASADSTGFDWTAPDGTSGHTPRYSYSSASSFGGGAGLTIEYPVYRIVGIRAVVQEWIFGGMPLEGDRARTLVGAGLSLRVR
jgi:hypothetical protein